MIKGIKVLNIHWKCSLSSKPSLYIIEISHSQNCLTLFPLLTPLLWPSVPCTDKKIMFRHDKVISRSRDYHHGLNRVSHLSSDTTLGVIRTVLGFSRTMSESTLFLLRYQCVRQDTNTSPDRDTASIMIRSCPRLSLVSVYVPGRHSIVLLVPMSHE